MDWVLLESALSRALSSVFSLKRLLLTAPTAFACGLLILFCSSLTPHVSSWIALSLQFLPLFFSSALLLVLGVILARMHEGAVRGKEVSFQPLFGFSIDLLRAIFVFSLPLFSGYLLCSVGLGILFLFKAIPWIGEFLSIFLSLGPFLFVFGSLLISVSSVMLLFVMAPIIPWAFRKKGAWKEKIVQLWKGRLLMGSVLFLIAIAPFLCVSGLIFFSLQITDTRFFVSETSMFIALQRLILMVPCASLLSPAIIFFFSFAMETVFLLHPPPESQSCV